MIIWATVGPSAQIIAACLPTLGPLLRRRSSSTDLFARSSRQRGTGYSSMGMKTVKAHRYQSSGSVVEQEIAMETSV